VRTTAYAACAIAVLAAVTGCGRDRAPDLVTVAERSGFVRTGHLDEVQRLCAGFQTAWPDNVRCIEFGRSPEGRPLLALAASADGVLDPRAVRDRDRPVVFMQGGIHAGEIDGKDAGFLALRQMLEGNAAAGALERATLLFVPVFNVDGHERFGRWNRPNQIGPEEMGWRTTAQNLNLNRDYTKAEAPEMQAMLRLLTEWDPILLVDLHVTDGAEFEHDVSLGVTPTLAGDPDLVRVAVAFRDALVQQLGTQGSLPLDFYPSFVRDDDPASGFAVGVSQARFSQQYWSEHNRLGLLVETHSWKNYPTRVRVTRNAIVDVMEQTSAHAKEWQAAAGAADRRGSQAGGKPAALAYGNSDHVTTIDFRGYAYTREPSAISGGIRTRYDNTRPQIWKVPLHDEVTPVVTITAPNGGYIVPPAHASWVRDKLALHGIETRMLGQAATFDVETFRASKATVAPDTFEGRAMRTVEGEWTAEQRSVAAGSLFVPIAQAKSHLVMTLLEPRSPDSFVSWGFFNTAFERKEYMEAYVAEEVAEKMLKEDASVKAAFEKRVAEDPLFAHNPAARLDFFYQRHPSWDERVNLYPIYRVARVP
jgi:zinc carboxypeptidase